MLSYKYIPKTGSWGEAEAEYVTLSPSFSENISVRRFEVGKGSFAFHEATWESLPTLHPIVNAFARLENRGFVGGYLVDSVGSSSMAETHILD